MDRLENGIVKEVLDWDERTGNGKGSEHTENLIKAFKACGVTFKVWRNRNSNKWEWTSLMGSDKRKILENLPDKFQDFLRPETVSETQQLWKGFQELHQTFTDWEPSWERIDSFQTKVREWGQLLVRMRGPGYVHTNVITPYMHIMLYHLPDILKQFKTSKIFTGQGVEKKNDILRRNFHRKINRYDACASLLYIEKRQETLNYLERRKRSYSQLNALFWEDGRQAVMKKIPRISMAQTYSLQEKPKLTAAQLAKKSVKDLTEILQQVLGKEVSKKQRKADLIKQVLDNQ